MYAVITKFVANANDTRYFSIKYLSKVLEKNNLDELGNHMVPSQYFDADIFSEQLAALKAYRDSFPTGKKILMYSTFYENGVSYSVQIFQSKEDFDAVNPERSRLHTSRAAFLNKINVSLVEVKAGEVPGWDNTFAAENTNLTSLPFNIIEQYYNSF